MLDKLAFTLLSITRLSESVVIPTNPFDMSALTPYFNDLISKVTLGATVGIGGFLAITGIYVVINFIKELFK